MEQHHGLVSLALIKFSLQPLTGFADDVCPSRLLLLLPSLPRGVGSRK